MQQGTKLISRSHLFSVTIDLRSSKNKASSKGYLVLSAKRPIVITDKQR